MKPVIFPDSEILILGTMPGKTSLKIQEYYAASNNCFWRVIEIIYNNGNRLADYNEKISCLKKNKIALCKITITETEEMEEMPRMAESQNFV